MCPVARVSGNSVLGIAGVSTLVKSLKVGGMEINFRELQNQIQENLALGL